MMIDRKCVHLVLFQISNGFVLLRVATVVAIYRVTRNVAKMRWMDQRLLKNSYHTNGLVTTPFQNDDETF